MRALVRDRVVCFLMVCLLVAPRRYAALAEQWYTMLIPSPCLANKGRLGHVS
jgi:hypothetical protein